MSTHSILCANIHNITQPLLITYSHCHKFNQISYYRNLKNIYNIYIYIYIYIYLLELIQHMMHKYTIAF